MFPHLSVPTPNGSSTKPSALRNAATPMPEATVVDVVTVAVAEAVVETVAAEAVAVEANVETVEIALLVRTALPAPPPLNECIDVH